MTVREPLRGVIPPVITPLTPSGDIDVTSLQRLVNFEVGAGVHAIFVLGTGGEGPYLTEDQQRITLDTVTKTVAKRIPVLAGVSDIGTRRTLHNAAIAQEYPIDALVSTSAFYGTVGPKEIDHHFRTIAASTDLPLYAYDIPVFTGVKLPAELTVQLAKDGVIAGVKDTSGEEDGFRYIIEHTRDIEGFSVITGSDITGDAAILQGAHGMIVGVANTDPHGFVKVYDAATKGDWDTARAEQERLHALRLITKIACPYRRVQRHPGGLQGGTGPARHHRPRRTPASATHAQRRRTGPGQGHSRLPGTWTHQHLN